MLWCALIQCYVKRQKVKRHMPLMDSLKWVWIMFNKFIMCYNSSCGIFFLFLCPVKGECYWKNDWCLVVACILHSTRKRNSLRVKGSVAHADTDKVRTLTLGQIVDTWKSQLESESNKWSFRWNREVERLSVQETWLKDKGSLDRFLRAQDDGTPLLKCHIEAIWCAGYSRRMVSIMACVVMTVCLYGLFPREWMDVLSPPIMPPSQQRRSGNTWNNHENLIRGTVTLILVLFARRCSFMSFKVRQTANNTML